MRRAVAIAALAFLIGSTAHAGEWPQHGYYRVDQPPDAGTCRFRVELRVNEQLVALILVPHPGNRLMAQLLTTIPNVIDAPSLKLGAGKDEIANAVPIDRILSDELPSFVAVIPNGSEALAKLTRAAHDGAAMRLTALPLDETRPKNGLAVALDDLKACLSGGSAT